MLWSRFQPLETKCLILVRLCSAVIEHTNRVIFLEDDDVAAVREGRLSIHRIKRTAGDYPARAIQTLQMELQQIMKGQWKAILWSIHLLPFVRLANKSLVNCLVILTQTLLLCVSLSWLWTFSPEAGYNPSKATVIKMTLELQEFLGHLPFLSLSWHIVQFAHYLKINKG